MKILTLNTWGESGPWKERWDIILKGLEEYAPDLVALQEVFNKSWAPIVAKRASYPYYLSPDEPDSGLVLLSRFPVIRSDLYAMRCKSPFEDYLRYAVWAEIEWGSRKLHFFTTHLSWMLEDQETRKAQVRELWEWMSERAGQAKSVLTGDLNAPPDSAEITWLVKAKGIVDAFGVLHPDDPGLTWDNKNPFTSGHKHPLPDRRIDYILVKGGDLTRNLRACNLVFNRPGRAGLFASDHFGVMAEFEGYLK